MERTAVFLHHISKYDHHHPHQLYHFLSQKPTKGFLMSFSTYYRFPRTHPRRGFFIFGVRRSPAEQNWVGQRSEKQGQSDTVRRDADMVGEDDIPIVVVRNPVKTLFADDGEGDTGIQGR